MKGVKLWLALSLALNLFLLGALVAGGVLAQRAFEDRRRGPPLFLAARQLPDSSEELLRQRMRDAARDARVDFRAAREARRRASELAAAPSYHRAATLAALQEAAAAETRGRAKLDSRLTEIFSELDPEARKALAPSLARPMRGPGRSGRGRGKGGEYRGAQQAPAPAAPD